MRTQASMPYSFGETGSLNLSILTYFKIHSLYYPGVGTWHFDPLNIHSSYYPGVGTWHSDPHHTTLVSERDTRSTNTILVSERDTRSTTTILVSERDTRSTTTILVSERDTRSTNTILVPERDTQSTNLILLVHQAFFYNKASSLTKRFQGLGFNSLIKLILSQLYNHIMQAHN